jgi:tetratricopeptide (TPR) repeat protein
MANHFIRILSIAVILFLSACATQPSHEQLSAIEALEQQRILNPGDPELTFKLALLYQDRAESTDNNGDLDRAASLFREVLTLAPGNIPTLQSLYNIYYQQTILGKPDAFSHAENIFNEIPQVAHSELNPPSLALYIHELIKQRKTKSTDTTRLKQLLTQAISEQPANVFAYLQLAEIYNKEKRYNLTIAMLRQGTEQVEGSAELLSALATAYEKRAYSKGCSYARPQDLRQAAEHYQRAIAYDAENQELHYDLARLYLDLGRSQLGLNETDTLLALEESADNFAYAAQHYALLGFHDKARTYLQRASALNLSTADSTFYEVPMYAGRWDEAAAAFIDYIEQEKIISVYDVLIHDIIFDQAGKSSDALKEKTITPDGEWDKKLLAFWEGDISAKDLQSSVVNTCEATEYFFYTGYREYQAGDRDAAIKKFAAATEEKTFRFIERPLAQHLLNKK